MKVEFFLTDIDYFDVDSEDYIRIWGRTKTGKIVCLIDNCDKYYYHLINQDLSKNEIKKLIERVETINFVHARRLVKPKKVEFVEKNLNGKKVKALKIYAYNHKDIIPLKDAIKVLPGIEGKEHKEDDVNFVTRYIIEKGVVPHYYYEAEIEENEVIKKAKKPDVDIFGYVKSIKQLKEQEYRPNILAFDIEASAFEIGKDEIIMISIYGDKLKKVLTTRKFKTKAEWIEFCKDEVELIKKFIETVKQERSDYLVGYFSDGFDMPYLRERAKKYKLKLTLSLDESEVSMQRGRITTAKTSGICHIDLFRFIENFVAPSLRSETLTLNEVASELIGDEKIKIDFEEMIKHKDHNHLELERFAEYNLQDSLLAFKLFHKLWPQMLELSRLVAEPLAVTTRSSYSQLVEHYIIHNLKEFNEIIEHRPFSDVIAKRRLMPKYAGAFVLEPKPGLYENIVMFDFRSLYPSIIISYNISPATLSYEPTKLATPEFELDGKKVKFYFKEKPGFVPILLKRLVERRKKVKEQKKKNHDPLLEARDLALKTLANASYGYFGFFAARYYSRECAASITALGRWHIKDVIEKARREGFKVIYGDSVDGKTKLIIKRDNKIFEVPIEDLFEKVDKKINEKEYNFKKGIEVLTLDENGKSVFKPIKYVMRHKCKKKMFRIYFTNLWYIDVTEDHSLIGYSRWNKKNLNALKRLVNVKAENIGKKVKTLVTLKKIPLESEKTRDYDKKVYEFLGYFIGDGSFLRNKMHKKYNKDYYIRISVGKDLKEILKKLIKPLQKQGYIKNYWINKKNDITINGLKLIKIICENFRKNNKKHIPEWLFFEKEENIAAFLRGFFSADGTVMLRNALALIRLTTINKDFAEKVRKLLYRLGISNSFFKEKNPNKYKDKNKIYSTGSHSIHVYIKDKETFMKKVGFLLKRKNSKVKISKNNQKKYINQYEFDIQKPIKVVEIKKQKYVYDIEVDGVHRFFANHILVHNTDSIALLLKNKTKKEALNWLKKVNAGLPGAMELELEDFYKRGIWVTTRAGKIGAKKKYALINENGKLKIRGFETIRRDWCDLAKEVQNYVIETILKEAKPDKALSYVRGTINKIKNKKIDIKKLIIKTQIKKEIREYEAHTPHIEIARKMQKAGMPVRPGTLVEYVVCEKAGKVRIREKVKMPSEIKDKEYDASYYINNQIIPAVENIFAIFGITARQIIEGKKQKSLFEF